MQKLKYRIEPKWSYSADAVTRKSKNKDNGNG